MKASSPLSRTRLGFIEPEEQHEDGKANQNASGRHQPEGTPIDCLGGLICEIVAKESRQHGAQPHAKTVGQKRIQRLSASPNVCRSGVVDVDKPRGKEKVEANAVHGNPHHNQPRTGCQRNRLWRKSRTKGTECPSTACTRPGPISCPAATKRTEGTAARAVPRIAQSSSPWKCRWLPAPRRLCPGKRQWKRNKTPGRS